MKTLIYQYWQSSDQDRDFWRLSEKSLRQYAASIGADYRMLPSGAPYTPYYGIFLPFLQGWCHDYDAICFVDSDVLATQHADNIFESASTEHVSVSLMNTGPLATEAIPASDSWGDRGHANSGVVVFPRSCYRKITGFLGDLARHWRDNIDQWGSFDQLVINRYCIEHGFAELDWNFNYHLGRYDRDQRWSANFIHYHRKLKSQMSHDFADARIMNRGHLKVIVLGSGPEMPAINEWDTGDCVIVGLNSVYRGTDKWTYLLSPGDFPDKPMLRKLYNHNRVPFGSGSKVYYPESVPGGWRTAFARYCPGASHMEAVRELGMVSYFGLMYWVMHFLEPTHIACLGLDMDYDPAPDGATSFYGVGLDMQTRGVPDFVHQINTYFDGDFSVMDRWFDRLRENLGTTQVYNLSSGERSRLPWARITMPEFLELRT